MRIRHSTEQDVKRIMEIYSFARRYMAEHGNPNQWGPTNWPPEDLIHNDIKGGNSYVCLKGDGNVIGTFFFTYGRDIEPTYRVITDGAWLDDSPYGVVHRIAGDGSEKGIGAFCINWAFEQCGHLRIDTHGDNIVMQSLLKKLGFIHCGTIHVEEDNYPRLAFEKITDVQNKGNMIRPITADHLTRYGEIYATAFSGPPWNDPWTPEDAEIHVREISRNSVQSAGYVFSENGRRQC